MRLTLVTGAAVLALLAGSVVAQDAPRLKFSTARPNTIPHGKSIVHPFVNKKFFSGVGVPSTIAIADFEGGEEFTGAIYIYDDAGTLEATYTADLDNPQGMASDRLGNLYVANTDAGNVLVFAPGNPNPTATWNDAGQFPADVDVRNNGGFGATTNIFAQDGSAGSVSLFRNGVQVGTVTDPNLEEAFFGAFDAAGNFYFDGFNTDGEVVIAVIPHANLAGPWTINYLTTSNSLEFPGGVQVTNSGLIAIDDQEGAAIYSYNPPTGGSLGSPVSTTALDGSSDAVTFAFKIHNHNLYTADASNLNSAEYAYPAGGSSENVISISGAVLPIGVAVTPTQMP